MYKLRKSADGLSPVWKGILTQSFTARRLSNQKSIANIVSTTRKTTLCWLQAEIKELRSFISLIFWIISQYDEAEGKKAEETKRESGGCVGGGGGGGGGGGAGSCPAPPPPPHAVLVSAHFSFRRLLHQNAWSRLLWRYSSVTARKKDTKLWLSYSREQTGRDHCTVCQILSLTDQIISSLTINIKSLLLVYLDHEQIPKYICVKTLSFTNTTVFPG